MASRRWNNFNKTLVYFTVLISAVSNIPLFMKPEEHYDIIDAVDFLHQYGYLDTSSSNLMDMSHVNQAIKRMQAFAGLNETGKLDKETKALINATRCGLPDVESSRTKRYSIHRWKWPKRTLTWRIHNYGNDGIPKSVIRSVFKRSLEKWSSQANLNFKQIYKGEPDIWFKFAVGAHGDPSPFKRPWDGVIAHAFYPKHNRPGLAGDIHFNDDKHFSVNSYKGKNLPWVAIHEIGHSIGMEHSKVKNSIMFPYYQSYKGHESQLSRDDIIGVQALYGKKEDSLPNFTKKPTTEKCFGKITAAFVASNKEMYMFNDRKLFILNKNRELKLGPISVWKVFKGVKSVDAAFRRHDGNTVLFTKKLFYVFSPDNKYVSGPHFTQSSFPGLGTVPGPVDSSFVWPRTNSLYVTKGNIYWRYYPLGKGSRYALVRGYPKRMQNKWTKLPRDLDAALTWTDGSTYLFKGRYFYKLTNTFNVLRGYPLETSRYWANPPFCGLKNDDVTERNNAGTTAKQNFTILLAALLVTTSAAFI